MSRPIRNGKLLALVLTIPLVGCGGDRLPVSPSSLGTPMGAPATAVSGASDYHGGDPYPGEPQPGNPAPTPAPTPTTPAASVTISIVGSVGTTAFLPNPLQAGMGATVAFTNNDALPHRIVLDDLAGTLVGEMAPGESSAPFTVAEATVGYHCTVHPSMTGTIQDPTAVAPTPTPTPDPSPTPTPPPPAYQPPGDYYKLPKN